MMAAAEARAAWQRIANRCFVQEDAKRAPKLACCSSSSSKLQSDASSGDVCNGPDHAATSFIPLNWNPSSSTLPPDIKWWLQLQPNFACPKDFPHDQLNTLDVKLDSVKAGDETPTPKLNEDPLSGEDTQVDLNKDPYSSLESHWTVSAAFMKHDSEARVQELKAVNINIQQPIKHKTDMDEFWYSYEFMDGKSVNLLSSDEKACFDLGTPWMESDKTEPWWRTANKDELATLVARKSLEHIENCDLPPPQTMQVGGGLFACLESSGCDVVSSSSLDRNRHGDFCNQVDHVQHSPASGSSGGKHLPSIETRHSFYDFGKPCSCTNSYSATATNDSVECTHVPESIPSKAELLEALRHSQTRAREAEKAAQQAYTEKEHIIKLFFRQASHIFAYKQWMQLLQLENLLLQLKMKDHHQKISMLLPGLPRVPLNAKKLRRGVHKVMRRKGNHQKCGFCKQAVVFVVGLSLAGAGLLLGWTMGWLLPTF